MKCKKCAFNKFNTGTHLMAQEMKDIRNQMAGSLAAFMLPEIFGIWEMIWSNAGRISGNHHASSDQ
jgi:hypothetical protein